MENIRRVFDWSERKITNWYTFHWVWVNQMLIKTEIHNWDRDYLPQIRKRIVTDLFKKLSNKWVLVADRGNDDKQFFQRRNSQRIRL